MSITVEEKAKLIKEYATAEHDTGSPHATSTDQSPLNTGK